MNPVFLWRGGRTSHVILIPIYRYWTLLLLSQISFHLRLISLERATDLQSQLGAPQLLRHLRHQLEQALVRRRVNGQLAGGRQLDQGLARTARLHGPHPALQPRVLPPRCAMRCKQILSILSSVLHSRGARRWEAGAPPWLAAQGFRVTVMQAHLPGCQSTNLGFHEAGAPPRRPALGFSVTLRQAHRHGCQN